jgi:hypothetical protein
MQRQLQLTISDAQWEDVSWDCEEELEGAKTSAEANDDLPDS